MSTTVILGGGFGGISAANTLRQLLPGVHEIVVIDQSSRFPDKAQFQDKLDWVDRLLQPMR